MTCVLIRSIGPVPLDVVVSEKGEAEMEVAQHPVERSAEIADHAWRKARKLTIEGVAGQGAPMAVHQAFHALQESPEVMTIVSGLKVYDSMLLQSLTAERDKEHSRILKFTAVLQEVIRVSTASGPGNAQSPQAGDASDRASAGVNRGEVQARALDGPNASISGRRAEQVLNQSTAY